MNTSYSAGLTIHNDSEYKIDNELLQDIRSKLLDNMSVIYLLAKHGECTVDLVIKADLKHDLKHGRDFKIPVQIKGYEGEHWIVVMNCMEVSR